MRRLFLYRLAMYIPNILFESIRESLLGGEVYQSWVDVFLPPAKEANIRKAEIYEFYTKYPDQFVTKYAATNPVEDIAESWTEFVMRPKPLGASIAEQKVLFFYEHPELVELRHNILQGVCQYAAAQK